MIGCDSRGAGNNGDGSFNPSFTGNDDSNSGAYVLRTVTTFYSNGASAGRYEVVQRGSYQYARREGGLRNTTSMRTTKMALTMSSGMEQHGFTFTKVNKSVNYLDISKQVFDNVEYILI